jgi:hypothetical protein
MRNSSNVNLYAAIGASNHPTDDGSQYVTRNYIIQDDKHPVEITSYNETEFTTWDSGSGEARFYYVISEQIHEMVCSSGSCWVAGAILQS